MKKIGVIVNTKRPHSKEILTGLRELAGKHNFELYAESREMAEILGGEHIPVEDFANKVDVALALGGDGTVLYTARALHGADIPIMGVNLGGLGFLTSVGDCDIEDALDALKNKTYKVSERDVAECRIFHNGDNIGHEKALNDIVIGWGGSSRIVTLKLSIDGEEVSSFMCDGMIISTPTGSTGHSLSAGGPILHPGICGFGISVICPHTLSSRPLVIPNSSKVEIEVINAAKELILSVDGQDTHKIHQGGKVQISRSPNDVKFLQLQDHSYFEVLVKKLHWRGSSL